MQHRAFIHADVLARLGDDGNPPLAGGMEKARVRELRVDVAVLVSGLASPQAWFRVCGHWFASPLSNLCPPKG